MKVLVAIKTCWKYRQRREAQRLTWLPELSSWATDHLFIAGQQPRNGLTPFMSDEKYVLSIQSDDDFSHIAPKVKAACQTMLAKAYDLLVVLDDDTYVVPSRLIDLCRDHYDEEADVTAYFRTDPIHYPQGSAYILSKRAAGILLRRAVSLDKKGPDDIIVGQTLIESGQLLKAKHTNRLHPGPERTVTPLKSNDIVTTHKCLPREMIAAHFDWLKSNG